MVVENLHQSALATMGLAHLGDQVGPLAQALRGGQHISRLSQQSPGLDVGVAVHAFDECVRAAAERSRRNVRDAWRTRRVRRPIGSNRENGPVPVAVPYATPTEITINAVEVPTGP